MFRKFYSLNVGNMMYLTGIIQRRGRLDNTRYSSAIVLRSIVFETARTLIFHFIAYLET
jgi:hypothetical protein